MVLLSAAVANVITLHVIGRLPLLPVVDLVSCLFDALIAMSLAACFLCVQRSNRLAGILAYVFSQVPLVASTFKVAVLGSPGLFGDLLLLGDVARTFDPVLVTGTAALLLASGCGLSAIMPSSWKREARENGCAPCGTMTRTSTARARSPIPSVCSSRFSRRWTFRGDERELRGKTVQPAVDDCCLQKVRERWKAPAPLAAVRKGDKCHLAPLEKRASVALARCSPQLDVSPFLDSMQLALFKALKISGQ